MGNAVKTKQYPVKKSSRSSTSMPPGAEELKQSIKRLETLMEAAPIGICHTDLTGKFTYVNKRFEKVSGYLREEVVGKSGFKIGMFSSQTLKLLRERIKNRLAGRPPRVLEMQLKCKDGHWIWVAMEGQLIWERGIPVGFQIIASDLTERKRAEEELLESEERFRSIVENSHDGIIILDDAYRLIYMNDELCRMSGYFRKESIGLDFRKFLDEESKQLVADRYIRRQRGEEVPPRYEFNFVRKDGEKRRVEISSSVIKDSAGKVKTVAQILDITESKQAEKALQAEKNKLRSVIDAMEYGLSIQEKDYNIIYQSELLRRNFGDHLGEKCYRVYESREKACDGCPVEEAFRDGKSHTAERRVVAPSGEVTFWENTANPIRDAGGRIVSCLEILRDITKRKQAEEALVDEATRRRILVDQSRDGIVILDQNGNVYEANQRFAEMLGYSPKETAELHVWDWEYLFPRERVLEMIRTVDEAGDHFETQHRRKDGSVYDVEISTNGAVIAGQKLVFCVCRDITERKRAEGALRKSEAKYRTLIGRLREGVYQTDLNGTYVTLNDAGARIFGFDSADQVIGKYKTIDMYYDLSDRAKILEEIKRTGSFVGEVQVKKGDGTAIWMLTYNNTTLDEQGNIVGYQGTFSDITERKQVEEQIRQAAKEWRTTFDSITDLVSILDKDSKLIRVNKAFADIFKMKPKELLGKTCYEMIHGTNEPPTYCPHQETLRTKRPATTEFFEPNLGIYLEENTSPIFNEKGEVVGSVRVARDVTERKEMDEQLIMTGRLASIGELASGIAHELNNPLTSVIGFSQLLMEKEMPGDMREDLGIICSEAQRAAGTVKNLLTFARKHAPVKQVTQINNVIEDVLKLRAYEQKVNNIEVNRRFAPDLPEIMIDQFQMQQVFLNIIVNAEYFMTEAHKRGTLAITTERVGNTVRISFADDGPGIPKENLSRLFSPFFTTKDVGKGTGLGLSICHGIVSEHRGKIYVRSQLGKGATFAVELPIDAH